MSAIYHRLYAPLAGRFFSVDPATQSQDPENPQTWNGYSYVRNKPKDMTDPLGLCPDASGVGNNLVGWGEAPIGNSFVQDPTVAAGGSSPGRGTGSGLRLSVKQTASSDDISSLGDVRVRVFVSSTAVIPEFVLAFGTRLTLPPGIYAGIIPKLVLPGAMDQKVLDQSISKANIPAKQKVTWEDCLMCQPLCIPSTTCGLQTARNGNNNHTARWLIEPIF
jgi:hypothetical protein